MKGSAKRDYPPCFNYQHPMWEHYPVIEDYFARMSYILSQGEAKIDTLLIHPVRSGWAVMGDSSTEEVRRIDRELKTTMDILLNGHIDFDLGDETIIEQHGAVSDGQFAINKGVYKVVIVPYSNTLNGKTFELLKEYVDSGGSCIAVRKTPCMIDAEPSDELKAFWDRDEITVCSNNKREILFAVRKACDPRICIVNSEGRDIEQIIYQEREIEGDTFLLMVNRDRTSGYTGLCKINGSGGAEEWNMKTGDIQPAGSFQEGDYVTIPFTIPATGSILLKMSDNIQSSPVTGGKTVTDIISLEDTWSHTRTHPNGLPLDFCSYRIDEGEWSERMMILKAHTSICKDLGVFRDVESRWVYTKDLAELGNKVEIKTEFEVKKIPASAFIAMEEAEGAQVTINGKQIKGFDGWYMDRALSKADIADLVQEGTNEVIVEWNYRDGMQIEEMYVFGDFGVDIERQITAEPGSLKGGDYCTQGYPFYSGSMVYSQTADIDKDTDTQYILQLNGYKGITALIKVNGKDAGNMSWPPFSMDITDLLENGSNTIEIEVVGSPRNLLGPNHLKELYPAWTGPGQFVVDGENFTEEYIIAPHGLNSGVKIVKQHQ
jgi:hypothetical protein